MVYRKTKGESSEAAEPDEGPVTTYDIARAIGISATTVSSILSERNVVRVSEATRQRVLEAAREMGYRRNGLARALRTGRANTIGIISPLVWDKAAGRLREIYLANLLAAISIATARAGRNAMTFIDTSLEELSADTVADGRVDGVILFGMPTDLPGAAALVRGLYDARLPCAEIGSRHGRYQVHADNIGGARRAVEHLVALGHRRIGYWQSGVGPLSRESREAGFRQGVRAAGLPEAGTPVFSTREDCRRWLQGPDRLTALFCYNDALALLARDLAAEAGLRIPEDLSLIGFDNSPYAEAMRPALTSVDNPLAAMAEAAVSLVLAQIEGKPIADDVLQIDTQLIERASTATAAIF